jgi:RNA polymerase sigma factor for flagellar operon FliA
MRVIHRDSTGASVVNEQHSAHAAHPGAVDAEAMLGLWESLRGSHDPRLRHRLIEHYMPLARKLAAQIYRHAIQPCSFDDYLQYGRLGLIEAVDSYDPARRVPFEVYSRRRIRGCILSAVGHESEAAARREFVRCSMPERVASLSAPNPSLQELVQLTLGIALGVLLEREELDLPDESPQSNPYAVAELGQLAQRVRALIEHLPTREYAVISGHYFDRVEFRVLADQLAVSKARVSQLHKQGLRRLQQMLMDAPGVNRRV